MFYKHNSFTGKLVSSEAQPSYQPQGFSTAKSTASAQVIEPVATGKGGSFEALSRIVKSQKIFQGTSAPIYVGKGAKDMLMYRGTMGLTLVGLAFTFYTLSQMALGNMKKNKD